MSDLHFDTLALHAGQQPDPTTDVFEQRKAALEGGGVEARMERHCAHAWVVVRFVQAHPAVARVSYRGDEGLSSHAKAVRYRPDGAGAMVAFGLRGALAEGRRFVDAVKIFAQVANVGDAKPLVIHPASTTHAQLAAGVTADMVRLSVGLQDPCDLVADLDRTLEASAASLAG